MKTEVSTRQYVFAHGKAPRGIGCWAFCPAGQYNADNYITFVVWFRGHYAEARKQAVEHFTAAGVDQIVVCS